MKNLANCTPREFLKQTNRIRKKVAEWLDLTKILDIRKNVPKLSGTETDEEKDKVIKAQIRTNMDAMLNAALEQYPDQTAELLGLLCFVEPEDLYNHRMTEFIGAVSELLNCQEVLGFLSSLAKLGQTDIFAT